MNNNPKTRMSIALLKQITTTQNEWKQKARDENDDDDDEKKSLKKINSLLVWLMYSKKVEKGKKKKTNENKMNAVSNLFARALYLRSHMQSHECQSKLDFTKVDSI